MPVGGKREGAGRKSLLTPRTRKRLLYAISSGATWGLAAAYAGIHRASFFNYVKAGRKQLDALKDDEEPTTEHAKLVSELEAAQGGAKLKMLRGIMAAGAKYWTAYAWMLERTYPDEFARRDVFEARPKDDGTDPGPDASPFDFSRLSRAERRLVRELLNKAKKHQGGQSLTDGAGE